MILKKLLNNLSSVLIGGKLTSQSRMVEESVGHQPERVGIVNVLVFASQLAQINQSHKNNGYAQQ